MTGAVYTLLADSFLFIAFCVALYIVWLVISTPLNRVKLLGDLGYRLEHNGKNKLAQLRRIQQLRCVGDTPPVYPNGWFGVIESRHLLPGDVKPVTIFGTPLVVFRATTADAAVYVVDAYCPHLGANLAVGGRVVNGNCIQCPFHGWIFDGKTGKCVNIPYTDKSIPTRALLEKWRCVERNQNVYVWFHCDGIGPQWEIPLIEEIESNSWRYCGRCEHEINAHIEDMPENGSDIAHLGVLHTPGLQQGNDMTKIDLTKRPWVEHRWTGNWSRSDENRWTGEMFVYHELTLLGRRIPGMDADVTVKQIGPGIVYLRFTLCLGDAYILQYIHPVEPLVQKMVNVLYVQPRIPTLVGKALLWSEAMHIERDVMIWNNKKYLKNPVLVHEESVLARHRKWYSQFYSDNSPRLLEDGSVSNMECIKSSIVDVNDW